MWANRHLSNNNRNTNFVYCITFSVVSYFSYYTGKKYWNLFSFTFIYSWVPFWHGRKQTIVVQHHIITSSVDTADITTVSTIRFLGLIIDSTLSWKQHIDRIIPKLNRACFAIKQVKPYMAVESLKTIYFSYFHSIITYGIIFWGNSIHSQYIFKIQKKWLGSLQIWE